MKDRASVLKKALIEDEQVLGERELQNWQRLFRDAVNISYREHLMKTWKGMCYQVHLDRTIDVLVDSGYGADTLEGWHRKVGLVFHDMLEDCGWTKNDIKAACESANGISKADALHISNIAYALMDEKGANRKERKPDKLYLEMIAHKDYVICKLCDRIVNRELEGSMGKVYEDEYPNFKNKLYKKNVCDNLWDYLDLLHSFKEKK
jgi:(p)ppGpp synthase/HD superfamily hydrolase